MHLILLRWPTMSEAYVAGMTVEVEPSCQFSIQFCCHATDGNRWQNGVWQEVHMQQRCVAEFFHAQKKKGRRTCWHQTVNASTMNLCVFQEGQYERQAMFWTVMYSCHITKQSTSQSVQPHELAGYDQGTVYRAEYRLQCIGNYGGNTEILQNVWQVGPIWILT